MPWYLALLLVATLLAGATGIVIVNIRDRKPKYKRIQDDFSLMLDTPAKKARHLKEHRDWDQEFHGYLKQRELIIWNGKLMSIEEADRSYYEEETIRRYNEILEKGKLILLSGCNRILGCNCGKRSCSFNTGTGRKSGWNSGQW